MELFLKNGITAIVRPYKESDFSYIQQLDSKEEWDNLVVRGEDRKDALQNSTIMFVVTIKDNIIGYVRGLTDKQISLFICELLIDKDYRGLGIGKQLLLYVHGLYPNTRLELLATSSSKTFYEHMGFRGFYGFRKTYIE